MARMQNPPHPGSVLRDWLVGHTTAESARKLGISRVTLSRILNGSAGISAEMDIRLSKALRTTPGLWLRMQGEYDLSRAQQAFRGKVDKIVTRPASSRAA